MFILQKSVKKTSLVTFALLFSLGACGPAPKQSPIEIPFLTEAEGLTSGTNSDGQKYTGFGPNIEMESLKQEVENGAAEFGPSVSGVQHKVVSKSPNGAQLQVTVTLKNGQSLRFSGEVVCRDQNCAGTLKRESSPATDMSQGDAHQIEVTCESSGCRVLKGIFLKDDRRLGGFVIRDEERILERTHKDAKADLTEIEELPAHVVSTEILGGVSKVQIESQLEKDHVVSTLEVPLLETDGECVDLEGTETSTCLMGNSREGEILLRQSQTENDKIYLRILPRGSALNSKPSKAPEVPVACIKNLSLKSAHPWIHQVAKECERPEIREGIRYWSQTSEKKRFESFLALRGAETGARAANVMDPRAFQVMLTELKGLGLPEVLAFVSYVESRFNPRLRSRAGAFGWWQLMPGTALENGLKLSPVDQRADIQRSTVAAGKFLITISRIPQWNQNLAMTLAAYNMGQNGLLKRVKEVTRAKKGQMAIEELANFSSDFWLLSRLRVLPKETRNYVPKIFSAIKISLSPKQYGVSGPAFQLH